MRDDLLRAKKALALANWFHVFREFAPEVAASRRTPRELYYRTAFFFHTLRRILAARFAGREHAYVFTLATQSLYDASVPGIPHFIYTDHTHLANTYYPAFDRSRLLPERVITLEREAYARACKILVMGGHVARSLAEHYGIPAERTAVVGAGSNVDPDPIPFSDDPARLRRIAFVGVDWERKGGPCLIEAFAIIRKSLPDARLVIVGCSPDASRPGVEIVGRLPRDEVKRHLARSAVLAFPTRIEPFGIAPIEASLQGLPTVASDLGALPEIVIAGVTGALVPPDDPHALASALLRYLADPALAAAHGQAARAHSLSRFTWDATGDRIRAAIEPALAPR